MAKASSKPESRRQANIPAHPRVPKPGEIGALCADIYRKGLKLARLQAVDEQTVEQLALDGVRLLMAECIKQSRADWKAYTKSTGVLAAYVEAKKPAKKKSRARRAA